MLCGKEGEVIINGMSRCVCLYRDVISEEFPIMKGDSTCPIDLYSILVELENLNYDTCFVPLSRV